MSISRRKFIDCILRFLIYICSTFSVLLLLGIIGYVLIRGISAVNITFLTSVTSVLKGTVGIAGNIVNTLLIILITMIIATPIGVGSAIYLNEYARPGRVVTAIESVNGILFINPGAISYARDKYDGSYAILNIDKNTVEVTFYTLI